MAEKEHPPDTRVVSVRLWLDKTNDTMTRQGERLLERLKECARCGSRTDKFEASTLHGDSLIFVCSKCYNEGKEKFGDEFLARKSDYFELKLSDWLWELKRPDKDHKKTS